ncbi:MAG: hypothetical protein KGH88_06585 [Thaumarchaeota archaeon]|nr:hypothetical protein [Nitrososphaerota archaeon]
MTPDEKLADQIVSMLVRTAIDLKRETSFVPEAAEIASESEILGQILVQYFKMSGRKIAETAYAALDEAGLAVEALAFSELWRKMNPDQNDLWATEEDYPDGNHN